MLAQRNGEAHTGDFISAIKILYQKSNIQKGGLTCTDHLLFACLGRREGTDNKS